VTNLTLLQKTLVWSWGITLWKILYWQDSK